MRRAEDTPTTFSRPLLINADMVGMLSMNSCVCPAMVSCAACGLPLYGTCSMSMPVTLLSISPVICDRLREAEVANDSLPGCALASATSCATVLTFSSGLTPIMNGLTPMLITAAKSRSASKPVDLKV